ncbi:unnamed protein product [Rhizophagus irregularis]|nr:unnamed protein product [Rhizophagus irregularis]
MIIQILAGSLYFNKIIYQIQLTYQTARYLLKTICEVMSNSEGLVSAVFLYFDDNEENQYPLLSNAH